MKISMSKRWGWKLLFVLNMSVVAIGLANTNNIIRNDRLNAVTPKLSPTLSSYEKIKMGNQSFTALSNDKFLLNSSLGDKSWNDASSAASNFKSSGSFSTKEKKYIATSLASKADLGVSSNNQSISSQIPTTNDWWLSDTSNPSYTKSYINIANKFDAGHKEQILNDEGSGVCKTDNINVSGGLPFVSYNSLGRGTGYSASLINFTRYEIEVKKAISLTREADGRSASWAKGLIAPVYLPSNHCTNCYLLASEYVGEYMWIESSDHTWGNWFTTTDDAIYVKGLSSVAPTNLTKNYKQCGTTSNSPVNAGTRPIVKTSSFDIFSKATVKDTTTGSVLGNYPSSGSGPYTLQVTDTSLKVSLDATHSTIKNGLIEVDVDDIINDNGDIEIPYDTSGSVYDGGTAYISAMDSSGRYKKLTTAKQNGKGTATINIQNIADLDATGALVPQEINLTLYQEEITGEGYTDYISKPVSIKIKLIKSIKPKPVTQINAVFLDDPAKTYTTDTWTNHDIRLSFSNTNADVTDTVTWEISEDQGTTWQTLSSNTFDVTTNAETSLQRTYLIKGKTNSVKEQNPKSFIVNIDKTTPAIPVVDNESLYTQDKWFAEDVVLSVYADAKASGIDQKIYVCDGTKNICESSSAIWDTITNDTLTLSQNGSHELYFKTVDIVGNESRFSDAVYVNINSTSPQITIRLERDSVKELLNEVTLGFFFKDIVHIDIEVNFGTGQSGKVYYIIDEADSSSMPAENDTRWLLGDSTSIEPDAKGKVYVKAISDAGVISYDSSILYVYADQSAPRITLTDNDSKWRNSNKIDVEIHDALSGVDPSSLSYQGGPNSATSFSLINDCAEISNLVDGEYDITVYASDYSTNSTNATVHVMIDTQKPTISIPNADHNGWGSARKLNFNVSDTLSDINSATLHITDSDGSELSVLLQADGSYTFEVQKNGTYEIAVQDQAGNEQKLSYKENYIDSTDPVISNIVIDHENDVWANKTVTFDVVDSDDVNPIILVTYVDESGKKHNVNVNKGNGNSYSFIAKENGNYTITASDHAGNKSTETKTISKIDSTGIAIVNISDIDLWVKDSMEITFDVREGSGGLASGYPKVTCDNVPMTLISTTSSYKFTLSHNGTCTIIAKNIANEEVEEIITIDKIDGMPPVINQVSSNTTDTHYRPAQTITYHILDYNNTEHTEMGSGLDNAYPKVTYIKDGKTEYVTVTQDTKDPTMYAFLADQNTTYTVHAMDAVGHSEVTLPIIVDHILEEDMTSPIIVKAYHDATEIVSGTWVNGPIRFEISGGLDVSMVEKYQVAITNGSAPSDKDFIDVNKGFNLHEVTGEVNGDTYYFRVVPVTQNAHISDPFIVNIDQNAPENVKIHKTAINTNPIANFIRAITFGNWMKDAQEITFTAKDNFTSQQDIRFAYAEEKDGVIGQWNVYSEPLTYNSTDIILNVKAIDLAGNESNPPITESLKIDKLPPVVSGVKDLAEYKQYYLPRFVTIKDEQSGLANASYTKDGAAGDAFAENVEKPIRGEGVYVITAQDHAGNEQTLTFKIVSLPNIETEIDGSDESKDIINQIQKEFDEIKDKIDQTEKDDTQEWLDKANEKWDELRKKVVEHEGTTSKVEGIGDTTFDPKTELIVEDISENQIPNLPKKAINVYDVYLKKGNDVRIQPDGSIKVYLPYTQDEQPIVYQIDENGNVNQISVTKENGYVTFTTNTLKKYAISNTAQEDNQPSGDLCVVGPDGNLNTNDDVCGSDGSNKKPDGSVEVPPNGEITFPNGDHIETPDGGIIRPDGSVTLPDGTEYNPDGSQKEPSTDPTPDPDPEDPNQKPEDRKCPLEGTDINIDTDGDGLPDINLDINGDCKAELNIDINGNQKPDLNIDTKGDGKPDINIDTDDDGAADLNILLQMLVWKPDLNAKVNGFAYDTMGGLKPDLNVDDDGDGTPDRNVDTDGDGIPDTNVDADWFDKHNIKKPVQTTVQGNYSNATGGAKTGDQSKWTIWWICMILTCGTMTISVIKKKAKRN